MNCYGCNAKLIPDGAVPETEYQFDNALWIRFDGGYGMFIDDLPDIMQFQPKRSIEFEDGLYADVAVPRSEWTEEEIKEFDRKEWHVNRVVICHECAHALCDATPWIAKLLMPHNSHSHKTDYRQANPDHFGWDYDMYPEG